ncbi:MAG: DUF502 domain-containing protein [Gemmatimonadales bacterium]|nr:DUF502 domain-containing protein [Gemmatimonadota bacterium]MCC7131448.1 DUF502 domain-containing protein [Gemmatimonadales bacterium]MDX2059755.1 DUF502 domain-containing protein [Gemmatimonadales bacterium]
MRRLANYFLRGLLITAPAALTFYLCWLGIRWVDGLLGVSIPGLGIAAALVGVTLIGALASNLVTRTLLATTDQALARLPFVRLLYTSIKDLLNAFVGEQRRFNRPVRARIGDGSAEVYLLGFVTSDALGHLGLEGQVAVYVPFSYSVAGHVLILPAARVEPLAVDSADAMAFILSGGVTRSAAPRNPTPSA